MNGSANSWPLSISAGSISAKFNNNIEVSNSLSRDSEEQERELNVLTLFLRRGY